jgi:hypothetical protein
VLVITNLVVVGIVFKGVAVVIVFDWLPLARTLLRHTLIARELLLQLEFVLPLGYLVLDIELSLGGDLRLGSFSIMESRFKFVARRRHALTCLFLSWVYNPARTYL